MLLIKLMSVGELIVEFIASCSRVSHNFAAGVFMLLQSPRVVMTSHKNVSILAPQVGSFLSMQGVVNAGAFMVVASVNSNGRGWEDKLKLCLPIKHWNFFSVDCSQIRCKFGVHYIVVAFQPAAPRHVCLF